MNHLPVWLIGTRYLVLQIRHSLIDQMLDFSQPFQEGQLAQFRFNLSELRLHLFQGLFINFTGLIHGCHPARC